MSDVVSDFSRAVIGVLLGNLKKHQNNPIIKSCIKLRGTPVDHAADQEKSDAIRIQVLNLVLSTNLVCPTSSDKVEVVRAVYTALLYPPNPTNGYCTKFSSTRVLVQSVR
jgi:hypothetical protein